MGYRGTFVREYPDRSKQMPDRSFAAEHLVTGMSPTETNAVLHEASTSIDPPPGRVKAVLFCPACEHEAHAAGAWDVRDDYVAGTRAVVCPDCGATVTERPLPTRSANGGTRHEPWDSAETRPPWATWRDIWRSSVELLTSWPRDARC